MGNNSEEKKVRKYCKTHLHTVYATCPYCKGLKTEWEEVYFCKVHGNKKQSSMEKCDCKDFEGHYMWCCPCGGTFSYEDKKYPQDSVNKINCIICEKTT